VRGDGASHTPCRLNRSHKRSTTMHTITFSDTEQTLLIELLTNDLIELRREIQHTDNHNYRDSLKEKESTLEELLHKLQEP
jgi:hypothetical protein